MFDYTICKCKQVSFFDVEDALSKFEKFEDVEKAFEGVQKITHCSTGCEAAMIRLWMQFPKSWLKTAPIKHNNYEVIPMNKYVCPCSYVCDPELGDPDNGVAPGTAWEDVPEDWVCPWCGLGKDAFEQE